jgi:hypothetical protein
MIGLPPVIHQVLHAGKVTGQAIWVVVRDAGEAVWIAVREFGKFIVHEVWPS